MNIHFIAIGGSTMHNLALALHETGHIITGSDDEISEPSRSRLEKKNLLPLRIGWFPEKITKNIDAVILGTHAREDNPELSRAKELGLKIYSYPEYLYEHSKNKKRVVIAGSHGKTTITSMILHVLKDQQMEFDFMAGAPIEGFDTMVRLSNAPVAIFEGDEYLTSPMDRRPKFLWYKPHIAVISGIAWNHVNVFPTFEIYTQLFSDFLESMEDNGTLFYANDDKSLKEVVESSHKRLFKEAYGSHPHSIKDHITYLITQWGIYHLSVFGLHNLYNVNAARLVCNKLGIRDEEFYKSIVSFKGAAKRLQVLRHSTDSSIYLDFAHAPSEITSNIKAVKEQYPDRKLIACLELQTFSSLNKKFMEQYKGSLQLADEAFVFINPEAARHKKIDFSDTSYVIDSFGKEGLKVVMNNEELEKLLKSFQLKNINLLLMSSGNFGGLDLNSLAKDLIK